MKAKSKHNGTPALTLDDIVAIKLIKKSQQSDNQQLEDEVNNLITLVGEA